MPQFQEKTEYLCSIMLRVLLTGYFNQRKHLVGWFILFTEILVGDLVSEQTFLGAGEFPPIPFPEIV